MNRKEPLFVALLFVCYLVDWILHVTATPYFDAVFHQRGCKQGIWEVDKNVTFTRMFNATSCVNDEVNGFEYWGTGAIVTRAEDEDAVNAFASNVLTEQFRELAEFYDDPIPHANFTMAIWFTPPVTNNLFPVLNRIYTIADSVWEADDSDMYILYGYSNRASPDNVSMHGEQPWFYQDETTMVIGSPAIDIDTTTIADKSILFVYTSKLDFYMYHKDRETGDLTVYMDSIVNAVPFIDICAISNPRVRFASRRLSEVRGRAIQYHKGGNGTVYHRFAVWDRFLAHEEILELAMSGMPNAAPSSKNGTVYIQYGDAAVIDLNTSATVRDYENDTIVALRLLSLPSFGAILHDGAVIEESDLPYDFTGNLTYETGDELHWSYPDCSLTAFQFGASDNGLNYSVSDSFVHVCISEVNFPPDVTPATFQLPSASSKTFQVEASDLNDDFSPPSFDYGLMNATSDVEAYRNTSKVSFLSINGTLGSIYLEDCETVIEAEEQYPLSTVFCYDSSNGDGSQGIDEFEVVVYDAVSSSSPGTIQFNNTNPLVATTTSIAVNEHPSVGSFKLGLFDALGRDESIVAQILSLPLNGTLRHKQNNSVVNVGDLVDGNLTYTGNAYYFNEFSDGRRENFYGEALPDLDTFTYLVTETTVGTTSDITIVSVHVVNVFTPLVSMSGMNDEIEVLAGAPYALGSLVQIQDKDNDEYCIGVLISTIDGRISFDVNQTHLVTIGPKYNNLTLGPCGSRMDDGCDEDLWFSARPRYINFLLSKMIFQAHKDKTLAASISFRGFKPGPDGITPDNFEQTFTQSEPQITGKVNVYVNGTLTDSPTKSPVIAPTGSPTSSIPTKSPTYTPTSEPGVQSMFIASIVVASVALVLAVVGLVVMCVVSGGPKKMCTRIANGDQAKTKTESGGGFDQEEMSLLGTGVYRANDDRRVRLRRANPF